MSYQRKYKPIVGENWKYDPNSSSPFKLSRGKIESFCNCERCFYFEVRLGFREPQGPGWAINSAVDTLLKKEVEHCRKEDRPHGLFKEYNLNIKPFHHPDLKNWQEPRIGIQYLHEEYNILFYGGVDDIMIDKNDKLVVVDFKATARKDPLNTPKDVFGGGETYKRQLEIYSWLLQKNGFPVSTTGYLMYYNGDASKPYLGDSMHFRRTLVEFSLDTDWIDPTVDALYDCLQDNSVPELDTDSCEQCLYRETYPELKASFDN
tara:strand:+ start:1819 stop:2604 length:786 start_codon:yes stop_codon:yes gene_type:complete